MRRSSQHAGNNVSPASEQPGVLKLDVQSRRRRRRRRNATVYDAVAGRMGLRVFLNREQMEAAHTVPATPEEVLLRRVGAPNKIPYGLYDADERLGTTQVLPDSDLLKAIHSFASDLYKGNTSCRGSKGYGSFDGTALLALGILLEEASKDVLGENGDMAFTELDGLDNGLPESKKVRYQIAGRVIPSRHENYEGSDDSLDTLLQEESPRKKRRRSTITSASA